jgi:hypothetical protein
MSDLPHLKLWGDPAIRIRVPMAFAEDDAEVQSWVKRFREA